VTGRFVGAATFAPLSLTAVSTGTEIFVAKYDAATGNCVLAVRAGPSTATAQTDQGNGIGVDAGGNAYVTGYFTGTAVFDAFSLTGISSFQTIFVAKFAAPLAPEIGVQQPAGTDLVDGTATNSFGSVTIGATNSLVFTITNRGSADLTGLGITINGPDAAQFTVTVNPAAPVTVGGSTTFTVAFTPASAGVKTAALHLANNDSDENPFDINLTGTGNTLPVAGPDNYTRAAGISLKIVFADLLANDSDPDLQALTITGFNLTTTNGVTLFTNATTVFYLNPNNVADQFTYTLTDAQGGSALGTVNISLVSVTGTNTVVSLQTGVPGAGTNTLTFAGIPGYEYIAQYATNLPASPWFDFSTNSAGTNGLWQVLDATATTPERYYRIRTP
jgi:hypothetical protein